VKQGRILLMFLTVFLLGLILPHFADHSSYPLKNKQHHQVIIFDWDSGTQFGDKTDKKISIVPGMSSFVDVETAVIILLLLTQCAVHLHQLRQRLFIGTIFSQSNYLSHFY
jgi:hypothetical protein